MPLACPSRSPYEIAMAAWALFRDRYGWPKPVRALTVRGINPVLENAPLQTDLFCDFVQREKRRKVDDAVDDLRARFGTGIIRPASLQGHLPLAQDKCETVPMPGPMYQ